MQLMWLIQALLHILGVLRSYSNKGFIFHSPPIEEETRAKGNMEQLGP